MYGEVSAEEFMRAIATIHNDPRHDSLKYTINDYLDVTSMSITPSDVDLFAASGIGASYSNPKLKVAVVATDPSVALLVRKYAQLTPYKMAFVDSIDQARQWLLENGIQCESTP
jgi:hypothetical protein